MDKKNIRKEKRANQKIKLTGIYRSFTFAHTALLLAICTKDESYNTLHPRDEVNHLSNIYNNKNSINMNKIISMLLLAFFFTLCSCNREDLDDIRAAQSEMEARLSALEAWQKTVNTDILHLQTVGSSLEANDYVLSVTALSDGSGYVINFSKSGAVTIKHGAKGETGDKGDKGDTGDKGDKGDTGSAPVVSVSQDSDGVFYWTLDGEWLTDAEGHKLRVTGEDGKDGASGTAGKDAIAPQVRINSTSNEWEISTDGGNTWTSTGVPATGDTGATGPAGATGDSWISGISYSSDGENWSDTSSSNSQYVKFTLAKGGGELVFPTQAWAKAVETQLETLTRQIRAFSNLISGKSFITKIEEVSESGGSGRKGQKITYVVAQADGSTDKEQTFTVYDGEKGADGTTPATPVIGVTKEGDNYYWTVNDEKLIDASGNFIPANGKDGAAGAPGTNAPAPQLQLGSALSGVSTDAAGNRIEDSSYYLSVDNGKSWYKVSGPKGDAGIQGPAGSTGATGAAGEKGDPGDSFFQSVEGKDAVSGNLLDVITFTLASKDGSGNNLTFEVLRYKAFFIGDNNNDGNATYLLDDFKTKIPLTLPSDYTPENYPALVGQLLMTGDDTSIVIPRSSNSDPWKVEMKLENSDGTYTATAIVTVPLSVKKDDIALLRVSLVTKKGNEITSTRALKSDIAGVGSYYYSDGSYSAKTSQPSSGAVPIGVIFYVGDVAKDDKQLREEIGDTSTGIHGLVVALKDAPNDNGTNKIAWGSAGISIGNNNMSDYISISATNPTAGGDAARNSTANKMLGYNNTLIIRKYNEDHNSAPVTALTAIDNNKGDGKTYPTPPTNTSGWYLPSIRELCTLRNGESALITGTGNRPGGSVDNYLPVNAALKKLNEEIPGSASEFQSTVDEARYNSSSEWWQNYKDAVLGVDFSREGNVWGLGKAEKHYIRPILAF